MNGSRIAAIIIAGLTVLGCFFSLEPGVIALAGLSLATGLLLLWSDKVIPILLLPFGIQWISVAVKPIEMVLMNKPLSDLSSFGGDLNAAACFGFLGLICWALGSRLGLGFKANYAGHLKEEFNYWPERTVLWTSLSMILLGHIFKFFMSIGGSFSEIVSTLSNITYSGLFILVYWGLRSQRRLGLIAAITLIEIIFGMTGFFGEFRTALFTVGFAAMAAQFKFRPQSILLMGLISVATLFSLVFWTAIKPEYRDFLNQGQRAQIVTQPIGDRLAFLADRVENFDKQQFDTGLEALLDRASYIDFLSLTLIYVPANTPHENGDRTVSSLRHIVTPRILFPDKPPLPSDTEVTARYTGLGYTNFTYVSISIGYLGELYIDYGTFGSLVAMLIFGVIIGTLSRFLLDHRGTPRLMNVGLVLMLVIPICYFEQALIKAIGAAAMATIIVFGLQRIIYPFILTNIAPALDLRFPRSSPTPSRSA